MLISHRHERPESVQPKPSRSAAEVMAAIRAQINKIGGGHAIHNRRPR